MNARVRQGVSQWYHHRGTEVTEECFKLPFDIAQGGPVTFAALRGEGMEKR